MKLKKLTCLFLALVLSLTGLLGLTASAIDVQYEKNCPLIYVEGFMACPLYKNPGTAEQEKIWPPSSDTILGAVKEIIPDLVKVSVTKDWDKFSDALVPAANKIFEPVWLNKDGTAAPDTGVDFSYPSKETVLSEEEITFNYDWRLSPLEIADQLNAFIEYVCSVSGSEKVAINAHSFGGAVTLTYISKYGRDRIQGVVFDSTAIYGEVYTGELFTGNIVLSIDSIKSFLQYVLDGTDYKSLVSAAIELLKKAGVLNFVMNFADELLEGITPKAVPQVLMPWFGRWLSIWAMCPDEYLEDAYKYIFGEACDSNPEEYAVLLAKLKAYDSEVRADKTQTLIDTEKQCRFGVFSAYGYSAVPVIPSWSTSGDGVVDAKYTSFGATVAPVGGTLSEEYLNGKDAKYISPDKQVDASTCLFPQKTWFIKNLKHSSNHSSLDELSNAILYSKEEVTVDTFEKYPQFLKFDYKDEAVYENKIEDSNMFIRFFKAILDFFETIKNFFAKIFG